MLAVCAADSLWDGTTAPIPRKESAAGIIRRTGSQVITVDVTLEGLWFWQAEGGYDPLHPGYPQGSHFTGSCLYVTLKPCRAAVYMVLTAHSLGKRTAAPGPGGEVAAGVSIRAAHLRVALDLPHCRHWDWVSKQLGQEVRGVVLG